MSRIGNSLTRALPLIAGTLVAIGLASTAVLATTYTRTVGGITITLEVPSYPVGAPLYHCEPQEDPTADKITVSGIPAGSTVVLTFMWSSGLVGAPVTSIRQTFTNQVGTVSYGIPYPEDRTTWPYQDGNTSAIQIAVMVEVQSNGTIVKVNSKTWKVICQPDTPGDFNGCTPGYWRQVGEPWANSDQHLDSWAPTGYAPGDDFETVFGVNASFDPHTLGDAVWLRGGGERAMARHAVAALLNATNPDVDYPMTVGEVIAAVQAAYTSGDFEPAHELFEGYNEIGCPIN